MSTSGLPEPIDRLDIRITRVLARFGVPVVRIALGIVFLWYGHQVHDVAGSLANTAALPPDQRAAIRGTNAVSLFGL